MSAILIIVRKIILLPLLLAVPVLSLPLSGCHSTPDSASAASRPDANRLNDARSDLGHIPPPSKNLYMSVGSMNEWQNPSITVQENMFSLHVMMPDANPSDLGKGTMLRPDAARRQILNITPVNLAAALTAIPKEAWPYGRVVAIEEAHDAPQSARPQLRRNIEEAIDTLQNIGVVADEWSNNKPVGVR